MPGHQKKNNLVIIIVYTISDAFFQNFRALPEHPRISHYVTIFNSNQTVFSVNITDQWVVDVPLRRYSELIYLLVLRYLHVVCYVAMFSVDAPDLF